MEEYAKIETARWVADSVYTIKGEIPERSITITALVDIDQILLLRESNRLHYFSRALGNQAKEIYEEDIQTRVEAGARMIDPVMPVQISGGVVDIASLLDSAEHRLSQFHESIETHARSSAFSTGSLYEELARRSLNIEEKLVEQTLLYLHTHLWILWTVESLEQAGRIHHLMTEADRFERAGEGAFAYVAHPPIIVSTLACTAMIEEVGAEYINRFATHDSVDPDETICRQILRKLETHYPASDDYDIDAIEETIVPTRHNISHYLTKRQEAVTPDSLQSHIGRSMECVHLVRALTEELLFRTIQTYQDEVLRVVVEK